MDKMQDILAKLLKNTGTTFEKMTPLEWERAKADSFNTSYGTRDKEDGYNCDTCRNKAIIARVETSADGFFRTVYTPCKCEDTRISIMRMKRSGLKDIIKDYTFDKFDAVEPWQKAIKTAAMEYAKKPEGWFFLGGQSGAGKTHLCTAICREFLLAGKRVIYMLWRDEIVKIKDAAKGASDFDGDARELHKLLDKYKTADVLYIDDLFKTGRAQDNSMPKPTAADINYAFEIINYRYNNPGLLTIISSELTEDELLDVDEAIGGRIYERATSFTIGRSRERNYRIRRALTL